MQDYTDPELWYESSPEDRIRRELHHGEKILWVGKPAIRYFLVMFTAQSIAGSIFISISAFILNLLAKHAAHAGLTGSSLIGGVPALFFLAIGFALVSSPWTYTLRLRQVVYAVTNQRGLVRSRGKRSWLVNLLASGKFYDRDFTPEQLLQRRLMRVIGFSRVDLVLATEWRKGSKGGSHRVYFGFFGLGDPEEVEVLIERTFGKDDEIRARPLED